MLADGWVLIGGAPAAGGRPANERSASGGAAALRRAPTLPADFPELRDMGAGELAALVAEQAKYAAFVRRLLATSSVRQVGCSVAVPLGVLVLGGDKHRKR